MATDQNATIQRDETFYPWGQVWLKSGGWFEVPRLAQSFSSVRRKALTQSRTRRICTTRWR